jgi:hypothetical protein
VSGLIVMRNRYSILSTRWRTATGKPRSTSCIACSKVKTSLLCGGWSSGSSVC